MVIDQVDDARKAVLFILSSIRDGTAVTATRGALVLGVVGVVRDRRELQFDFVTGVVQEVEIVAVGDGESGALGKLLG